MDESVKEIYIEVSVGTGLVYADPDPYSSSVTLQ